MTDEPQTTLSPSFLKLIEACRTWRASLERDGWTEDDIRDVGRPGLGGIIAALDEIDGR